MPPSYGRLTAQDSSAESFGELTFRDDQCLAQTLGRGGTSRLSIE